MRVIVHRDSEHLAASAASLIADAINGATERFSLGMAGGSTPLATYRRLRELRAQWAQVDAWVSDERWVPLDHADCNGHQAAVELLDHVDATFHRPRWAPWLTASDSAAHYDATLRTLHPSGRADLILLGMGDDGHTASLFPGTAALDAPAHRWFVENFVPKLAVERLTTTLSFLRAARQLVFLVAGEGKADALKSVLEARAGEKTLPAARVLGGAAEVSWLVDEAAAKSLTSTSVTRAD